MIQTTHLFSVLDQKLIALLQQLQPGDWNKPTLAKKWTVKDIAAHLLDGNLRNLSVARDHHTLVPGREINTYEQLVNYLNQLNADWVNAAKRLSPETLIGLLQTSGKEYSDYLLTLNPDENAIFSVAWAGEQISKNWFHIAREYTEKWHHQQQIREAVGVEGIMTKELFYPVMDTFMCGLPYTYRNTIAPAGTTISITVDTAIGGSWYLTRLDQGWKLSKDSHSNITAALLLKPGTVWKLFTKGITLEAASEDIVIEGNTALANIALSLIAVMA